MGKARLTDLRKAYPELEPDKDYPPLEFKSLKGRVSAAEWEARVDCACAYRLVRHCDMHDLIYNHMSARIPGTEHFLLNPFGLLYEEICASSLIKPGVKTSEVFSRVVETVRANGHENGYIRLSVSRGAGLGLDPPLWF